MHHIKSGLMWYCNNASIHGLHYISKKESSMFTRLFFGCVAICSFVLCMYLIILQILEYEDRAVMTTVTSTAYPVWKVRFPSVTICNFNVVYKDNVNNLKSLVKLHGVEDAVFTDLVYNLSSLILYDDLEDMSDYKKIYEILHHSGYQVNRIMAQLAQSCDNMIKKCYWQTEEVPCAEIFHFITTTQGYCCAFNYDGIKGDYYTEAEPLRSRFHHVGGAGPALGLRLFLDVAESQYVSSIRSAYGLNILVQDALDYPDMELITNTLRAAEELTISVTPKIYVSSPNLRGLSLKKRQCLFQNEGNLSWTNKYSYKTCINECKAKAMYKYCKCTPFYYPIENNRRYCTLLDVPCLKANKYKYSALDLIDSFYTGSEIKKNADQCTCYPQCNQRMYDLHTDRAQATPMIGYEYSNLSILNVHYDTIGCIRTDWNVYYTWDRVIATIGGIFGLCLGGSIISILECLYFLSKFLLTCYKAPNKVEKLSPYFVNDFMYLQYGNNYYGKPLSYNSRMVVNKFR